MKRLIKIFIFGFALFILMLVVCLHSAWFQKACLWMALHYFFQDVRISNYQSSYTSISVGKITGQSKNLDFSLNNFVLDWNPWKLLLGKGLYVHKMNGHFNLSRYETRDKDMFMHSKAGFLREDKDSVSKKYSFLKNIQPPIKLHIGQLNFSGEISLPELDIKSLVFQLKDVEPEQMGEGQCTAFVGFKNFTDTLFAKFESKLNVNFDSTGFLQTLRCNGNIHLKNKHTKFNRIKALALVSGSKVSSEEEFKVELHYGQANDFVLSGKYLKATDHIISLKWQALCDHSLIQVLCPEKAPVISVLGEGDFYLNRKTLIWDSHNYVSVWAKNFEVIDPGLKSLPKLSLKVQIDAGFDTSHIDIKQVYVHLKEKGSSQSFVLAHSLQPLAYNFKTGLKVPSEKEAQVFEINFYKTPFELFNPYLQAYNCQLYGSLESGSLNVIWSDSEQAWKFSTLQPIRAFLQKATFNKDKVLSDSRLSINGSYALKNDLSRLKYNSEILFTDSKFIPFLTFFPRGNVFFSDYKFLKTEGDGSLTFNALGAKNCLNTLPFSIKFNPDMSVKVEYSLKKDLKNFSIENLQLNAYSTSNNTSWIDVYTDQILYFDDHFNIKYKNKEGDLLSIQLQQCPLDLVQYHDYKLSGNLSYQAKLSALSKGFQWTSITPLKGENLHLFWNKDKGVDFKEFSGFIGGSFDKKGWDVDLKDLKVLDETSVLFQGQGSLEDKKDVFASQGQFALNLDALCKQPFAISYPGCVGNVQSHWQWDDDKKIANAHINLSLPSSPFVSDANIVLSIDALQTKKLQSRLELRAKDHVSDVSLEGTLDTKNVFSSRLDSKAIYGADVLGVINEVKSLKAKYFPDKNLTQTTITGASVIKETPVSVSSNVAFKTSAIPVSKDKEKRAENPPKTDSPYTGSCMVNLNSIYFPQDLIAKNIATTIDVQKQQVAIKELTGELFQGQINGQVQYRWRGTPWLSCALQTVNLNLQQLWKFPEALGFSLNAYGQLKGTGDVNLKVNMANTLLQSLRGIAYITARDGCFSPMSKSFATTQAVLGLTTTVGLLAGGNISGLGTIGFLSSYLQKIPFQTITIDIQRSNDTEVAAEAEVKNKDVCLRAQGHFNTDRTLASWKKQTFQCQLNFSAPDTSPLVKYFDFDTNNRDVYDYLKGPQCIIDGTLGKPNYAALIRLVLNKDERLQFNTSSAKQTKTTHSTARSSKSSRKPKLQDVLPVNDILNLFKK